jgi:transcriptional regulator with XRE-family HTH domain
MGDGASQLLDRRRLRTELRNARLDRGMTQEQVATAMEWSLSKMIRIEGAQSGISTNDLKALLPLYGITDEQRVEALVELARAARARPWWHAYRGTVPESLLQLIEFESAASVIRQCETVFIPGILQTEEYARAVLENYYSDDPDRPEAGRIAEMTDLRTRRHELLDRDDLPTLFFRLDEAVIRRLVGSAPLMRRQLRSLIDLAGKPNVTIEIMPFSAGLHAGLKGPFEIVEFVPGAAAEDVVVFLESPRGDIISDKLEETAEYRESFERLGKVSLGPEQSVAFLEDAIKLLG